MAFSDDFAAVCFILGYKHSKGEENDIAVFNRVFRKCLLLATGTKDGLPTLTRVDLRIALVSRKTEDLCRLIVRTYRDVSSSVHPVGSPLRYKKSIRRGYMTPVITVKFRGIEYLLDGNRRLQYIESVGIPTVVTYECRIK